VLGAILLDNEAFHPAIEILEPADFPSSPQRIFTRMVTLSSRAARST
jgi:replicative DNA helicase